MLLRHAGIRTAGTSSGPLDSETSRGGRIEVKGDLAETLGGTTSAIQSLLEEVVAGGVTGNTTVNNATKQR
jgi:hypothetical protein